MKNKKDLLAGLILVAICVLGIVAMMIRSEQLDKQKELSLKVNKDTIVQNSHR